jgi:outer membrane protein OmpA-like peptidoglycan-associated protein
MTYLISHFWGWLAVIAALGFLGSRPSHGHENTNRPYWFFVAAALLALGGIADFAHLINGRLAFWLETGILSFAAFVLGGQAGAPGRLGAHMWGSFLVAGLVWVCSNGLMLAPTETALKAAAGEAATAAGGNALDIGIAGRDALMATTAGDAAKRAAIADGILQTEGIRSVGEVAEIPGASDAKAAVDKAAADKAAADKAAADKAAADAAKAAADAGQAAANGGQAAGTSLADKKAAAIAAAKTLPDAGPLAAAQCQTALSGLAAAENVKFDTGSAKVSDVSKALIGKIGATLARCAETRIEIAGHTDSVGDPSANKTLSQRRAESVADLLKSGGANAARLTAVGYGQEKPVASNDTPEGRAENRRIEFLVK